MKKILLVTLPVALVLLFLIVVLIIQLFSQIFENRVIASLPKYESSDCYYSDGFQDFTNYCKYYFSKDGDITENLKKNRYLKVVSNNDVEEIKSYFENFNDWVQFQEYKDKYDFRDECIDTSDYFYIENKYAYAENYTDKYSDYNVYFFDVQTMTLYFIHSNI